MKISYNPITAEALTTAPDNNDITFDLSGLNIFVKGVRFRGTDTTYKIFKKYNSSNEEGYDGLVPAPSYSPINLRYLREDGTWQVPSSSGLSYILLENVDLDTLKIEGMWYYSPSNSSNTNCPDGFNDGAELYIGKNSDNHNYLKVILYDGTVWFRIFDGENWNVWTRLYSTDENVSQILDTSENFRPIVLGYTNSNDTSLFTDITQKVYTNTSIYAQPSTGSLWANMLYSQGKPVLVEHQSLEDYVTLTTALTITGSKTFTSPINSIVVSETYLGGNLGKAIINSLSNAGSYTMLFKGNSINGYFTLGIYEGTYLLQYTAKSTVDEETNDVTYSVHLLDESGNSLFPGNVRASGTISGNILESRVETGTSPLNIASTTLVNNLNVDLLDGKHYIDIINDIIVGGENYILNSDKRKQPISQSAPASSYNRIDVAVDIPLNTPVEEDTYYTLTVWYKQNGSIDVNRPFSSFPIGKRHDQADGWSLRFWADQGKVVRDGEYYKWFGTILINKGSVIKYIQDTPFIFEDGLNAAGMILYMCKLEKGNKSTDWSPAVNDGAVKLLTPRILWGNNFDGTRDISGRIIINPTNAVGNFDEGIRIKSNGNNWSSISLCGIENTSDYGTSINTWAICNNNGLFYINRNGSSNNTGYELCNVNGNWGIGTVSPSYKLHIEGNAYVESGLTSSGDIILNQNGSTGTRQIRIQCGDNDYGRIAAGATGNNAGYLEIATADDGNEPIYFRQYTGVFRTLKRTLTLLDGSGNTSMPGSLSVTGTTTSGNFNTGGRYISNFASGTWINSVTNAVLTCNYSNYGGIINAPTKGGRITIATYPNSDNIVYLGYATSAQISAGTNAFNRQARWSADNGYLYVDGFVKNGSSDSYVLLGGGGHKALSDLGSSHTHSYLPLTGGTLSGKLSFSPKHSSDINPSIYSSVDEENGNTALNFLIGDDSSDSFIFRVNYWNDTNEENRKRLIITWSSIVSKASITAPSFKKSGSSDSYVLLGGGGHKALSTMLSEYDARYVNVTGDTMTGKLTIQSSSLNGTYNGLLVGDDCNIGDCNIGNTIGLMGTTNNNAGMIKFGKGGYQFGYNGSTHLVSGTGIWTNFNADLLDGKHLSSIVHSELGYSTATTEANGTSSNLSRSGFWRDNSRYKIGVFACHSTDTRYGWELACSYFDATPTFRIKNNGTWGLERLIAFTDNPGLIKYWAIYTLYSNGSNTKKSGNYNFISSSSKRNTGRFLVKVSFPSGYNGNNTIMIGLGILNNSFSSQDSLLYVTMGAYTGNTYYVNTGDNSTHNDGSCNIIFLCL